MGSVKGKMCRFKCWLREISRFLIICLNWLRLKCSRAACDISSSVFCFISVCNNWKEKQTMWALSCSLFLRNHHKIHQNKNEADTGFDCSVYSDLEGVPRELAGFWSVILFPTLISLPLSDLPYPQKEVLAFGNPHTSQL